MLDYSMAAQVRRIAVVYLGRRVATVTRQWVLGRRLESREACIGARD